jgi:predicted ATPase
MARLLGLRIKNFRSLADFSLGGSKYGDRNDLPQLVCLIGPNGSGKSSVLDAFGFISDCLTKGVEAACDTGGRGGFERIRTKGKEGPLEFELFFEDGDPQRPIAYKLQVDLVGDVPTVTLEELRQRRPGEFKGKPYYFLKLKGGSGKVWTGDQFQGSGSEQRISFVDQGVLGISTLGNLSEHPRISHLREYIEGWYLSYFVPDAARSLPIAGAQPWLDRTGSNLGNVLQYIERQHPTQFKRVLKRLAEAVPGMGRLSTEKTPDGRLLLRFQEAGYSDPFYQQSMSDGTLKMLAYAILLESPNPRPLIGIEEPENGLYVKLIEQLSTDFAKRSSSDSSDTQIFLTTHSPYFVDGQKPENVWLVHKGDDGHTTAKNAADMPTVRAMTQEGLPLGSVWYSDHFEEQ